MEEKKIYGVIYVIINLINGKKYVGQTTRTVEERFREHAKSNTVIGKAIRKYGKKNFKREAIEECYSAEELNAAEMKWIKELDCKVPNGYNLTDGGEGSRGCSHPKTEEEKAHLSAKLKGRKFTDEHRANISAGNKGRKPSQKTKDKISETLTGRKYSDQHRANISAGKKGKKKSEKTRQKMATYAKNRPDSHNKKIAESLKGTRNGAGNKGRVCAEETKAKISATLKVYFAKKRVEKENIEAAATAKFFGEK